MDKQKLVYAHMQIGGGSHLPLLIKLLQMTKGPVLELGMGIFSTPFLHWACYDSQRKLVSYESDRDFFELFDFKSKYELKNKYGFHELVYVPNWDEIDFPGHWSIALIDHIPTRRIIEIKKLVHNTDFVVIHDTNGRWNFRYKFTEIYPLFKYRYDYHKAYPQTTVVSNLQDLDFLRT